MTDMIPIQKKTLIRVFFCIGIISAPRAARCGIRGSRVGPLPVFDHQPFVRAGVELVTRVLSLGDDALHLTGAGRFKQRLPLPLYGQRRHELLTRGRSARSAARRCSPGRSPARRRNERDWVALRRRGDLARIGRRASTSEIVEDRPAIAQADPLAVNHRGSGADRGTGGLQLRELDGDALAVLVQEDALAVPLWFKNISVIIKCLVPNH